jgi:hypothetical protein
MSALSRSVCQLFGRSASALLLTGIAVFLIGSQSAHAGLIFTQVEFDGQVRSGGGDGSVAGVEEHFTNDDFPPPTTNHPLPATNAPLPAPLDQSNDLRLMYDFAANAVLDGEILPLGTMWITSPTTGNVFANHLDNTVNLPVDFDTTVYLEELGADEQLVFKGIQVESGQIFPAAAETMISSGRGSAADPIQVHLGLTQEQVDFGLLKVRFFYDTEMRVIPEPTAGVLILCGLIGAAVMRRHRVY